MFFDLLKGKSRGKEALRNIIYSLALKGVNILLTLLIVPLTIGYVNPTKYGIWLTLSSMIAWLSYFDFGFAHGFRNRFAEAIARKQYRLAREYVSTTYAVLFLLFGTLSIFLFVGVGFINWSALLNVDAAYNNELEKVAYILVAFFSISIVADIFCVMLVASQKPALSSAIKTLGQLLAFTLVFIMTKTVEGNLEILAFALIGVPAITVCLVSAASFRFTHLRKYAPAPRYIKWPLTKKIIGMGGQFFAIMLSMLFVFQLINLVLSRIAGPEVVTQYNVAYKFFNLTSMLFVIVLNPFWSAFTEAYTVGDFEWMKKMLKRLEKVWLLFLPTIVLMLICADWFYKVWVGTSVHVTTTMSAAVAVLVFSQLTGNLYMYLINGTGKVRLQLCVYSISAVLSIPALWLIGHYLSIEAVLLFPALVCVVQAVLGRIQLKRMITGRAVGIWNQ